MSVTLTSTDLGRLDAVLHILLSPLRYDDVEDWRVAVRRCLKALIGARNPSLTQDHMSWRAMQYLDASPGVKSLTDRAAFDPRDLAILRLLRPAYRAGMRAHPKRDQARAALETFAHGLEGGIAIYDGAGKLIHRNPALISMLCDEPERDRLTRALGCMVAPVLARRRQGRAQAAKLEPCERELSTSGATYLVRAMDMRPDQEPAACAAAVFVERTVRPPGALELSSRYQLTPREQHVARLLATGQSTPEMASTLGISIHTMRRHAEHLMTKLGVHSRAAVVARLRAD